MTLRNPSVPQMLVSAKDAARALDISTRTLWGLTNRGEMPHVRIGRAVRYDTRDLVAFINRSKSPTAARGDFPGANAGPSVETP